MSETLNETAGRQVIADLERSIAEAQGAVEALRRFYGLPLVVPPPPPRVPSAVCRAVEQPAKALSRPVLAKPAKQAAPAKPAPAKPVAAGPASLVKVDPAAVAEFLAKFDRVQPETRRSVEAILAIGKPFNVAQFQEATGVELKAAYSTLHRFVERKIIERVGMGLYQVVKPEPALAPAALSPEQLLAQHRPQPAADLDPRLERDEPNED